MKKTLLPLVLLALTLLFTSCDNGINGLLELFTGDATSVVNGDSEDKYTSSIIMFNEDSDPSYAIGLATAMDVTELVHISGVKDLEFPFLTYRLVHNNLSANTRLEVDNTLTEEDLVDFDYRSLLSGKFANNQVVGIAKTPTLFYVMKSGSITVTKVKDTKVEGTYAGDAYVINLENSPMLSDQTVPISGSFSSKVIPMMDWLLKLQEEEVLAEE